MSAPDGDLALEIAKMPAGFFWHRWGTIISEEEGQKLYRGEYAVDEAVKLHAKIDAAGRALGEVACAGIQGWMTVRRAAN